MKQIISLCKQFIRTAYYKEYRIVITENHIEVKLTPKNDNDEEVVWMSENNRNGKVDIIFNMESSLFKTVNP